MGTLKAKVAGVWTPVSGNGQAAANVARWNSAWGVVATTATQSTTVTAPTANAAISPSVSIDTVAGRRYRATMRISSIQLVSGSPIGVAVVIRSGTSGSTSLVDGDQWMWVGGNYSGGTHIGHFNGDGTTKIAQGICETVNGANGTSVTFGVQSLMIEDVGPITPAAIAPPYASPRVVASGNSLGIIALSNMRDVQVTGSATTITPISDPLNCFLSVGRRYRIFGNVRAFGNAGGTNNGNVSLYDNGIQTSRLDQWFSVTSPANYCSPTFEVVWDGDNLQHSFDLRSTNSTLNSFYYAGAGTRFYVEDIGPNSSPALPISETYPSWTALTLQNSFVNAGSPRMTSGYRKLGDIVDLRMAVKGGTVNQVVATLPVGFRPAYLLDYMGRDGGGAGVFNIQADGGIVWYGLQANNTIVYLNCMFSTTA